MDGESPRMGFEHLTVTISIPHALNFSNALKFREKVQGLEPEEDYVFDFRGVGHTEPFGLLLTSDTLSRFKALQDFGGMECCNHEHLTYQGVMGFFRAAGFDFGHAPGAAAGSPNYLPITHLSIHNIQQEAQNRSVREGEIIEEHALRMATVLARTDNSDLCEALTYTLREIIRNVLEHSGADEVHFCAQHWPTKERVHLAILDRGQGIRKSLSNNPHLTIRNDLEALKLSLMPGVSGRMYQGVRKRKHDVWQNSGYGLYMTSRMAVAGGNFWILSGRSVYGVNRANVREIPVSRFSGTALRISLDTSQLREMQKKLKKFRDEGHEIARQFTGSNAGGASLASTMIRTRF